MNISFYIIYTMRIAIIIQIEEDIYTNKARYKTLDTIIEWHKDNESLETQIMNKYPHFGYIEHCEDKMIVVEGGNYFITSVLL